jgi:hypothetical protein
MWEHDQTNVGLGECLIVALDYIHVLHMYIWKLRCGVFTFQGIQYPHGCVWVYRHGNTEKCNVLVMTHLRSGKKVSTIMSCPMVKVWQRRLCVARRLMKSWPPYRNIWSINYDKLSCVNCIMGNWAVMEFSAGTLTPKRICSWRLAKNRVSRKYATEIERYRHTMLAKLCEDT